MANQLDGVRIVKNLIGTKADGTGNLSNGSFGMILERARSFVIDNVIVGHNGDDPQSAGILIAEAAYLGSPGVFQGNRIGVAQDRVTVIPNKYGIIVHNRSNVVIEGFNIISGNLETGIAMTGTSSDNTIENNFIGINDESRNLGNARHGIWLDGEFQTTEISGNHISGNGENGILLSQKTSGNSIHDNEIGVAAPNRIGINLLGSSKNSIVSNVVANNQEINISLGGLPPGANTNFTEGNEVFGNQIENGKIGIALLEKARNNKIGEVNASQNVPNTIINHRDGLGVGIYIGAAVDVLNDDFLPNNNKIIGNRIGEPQGGAYSNKIGVFISQAQNNFIGGQFAPDKNFINANEQDGIRLTGGRTTGNLIGFNNIGISDSNLTLEDSSYGNGGNGISLDGVGRNDIRNNAIGHNRVSGISLFRLAGTESVRISGNQIGAGKVIRAIQQFDFKAGNASYGIFINNSQNVLIGVEGNSSSEPKNVVSANGGAGIYISNDSKLNRVNNSVIGTTESGRTDVGNAGDGIYIVGGRENTIGGGAGVGNVIAGNAGNGVFIQSSNKNRIYGNHIGVFARDGVNAKLGNALNGVKILESAEAEIGHAFQPPFRNIIGGNGSSGVVVQGEATKFTRIKGNYIGADSSDTNLGNLLHGVYVTGQGNNTAIGGKESFEAGNTIAFNRGKGVWIDPTAGNRNGTDPNRIFQNGDIGLDIGASGLTPNDAADADEGANRLQNYPELISAQIVGSELIVKYKVDSAPGNSDYGAEGIYVEFFRADADGEGEKFLGSDHYTPADYNNGSPQTKQINLGNANAHGVTSADGFTATASDAANNTSEFTPALFISAPPVTTVAPGQLIISELRLSGETNVDEYVELYNNTDAPLDISGVRLESASGLILTVPSGVAVPARGHYLIAHATGYTLPASAAPDQTYNLDLPTTNGLVLLNPNGATIDAVGFASTGAPHKEGTALVAPTESAQYAFVRNLESGRPGDTDDNAADFILVTPDPSAITSLSGDRLGAPGPENMQSHIQRNATIKNMLIDQRAGSALPPNRVRQGTPVTHGSYGTLSFRRRVRNLTGATVTQLRFRIVALTTKGSPGAGSAQADLRAVNSPDVDVTTSNGLLTVKGTVVDQSPAQTQGGGVNSSFVVTLTGGGLAPDSSLDVQLMLGVEQGGNFRFFVNTEAITSPVADTPTMKGGKMKATGSRKKK